MAGRVEVDGKFFRIEKSKFFAKGITYGPFAPDSAGETFASREQTDLDFKQIVKLGANVLRVYYVPPRWFLDLAEEHHLKVFVDVPWAKHLCFMDSRQSQLEARRAVREAVQAGKDHPAVFAYSLVNEISPEIVRWSGVKRVERFIDELVDEAKAIDPGALCTFSSFPPTEYLQAEALDFVSFNVYLHHPQPFENYLARLQTLADAKPLILGEFGMDSIRQGETHKCEFLSWQIELACRAGLAGTVLFSYTDDWFRGGMQIEEWGFGLTTRDRRPKQSFFAVQQQYRAAPHFPLPKTPKVSVVVATYNGSRTLRNCLESLVRLNYPDYEVIVIDDGSTDETGQIATSFPKVRYVRQTNQGLSAARNAGIHAATGEIVAFTDDDCRADEDWLYYLVSDLTRSSFSAIGGHNFLPPEDSVVAGAVAVSPGGPAHVMLSDREAEHIPGCNMAFYKWALDEIGGFDSVFRKAGDDVDVCWRLQDRDRKIGFSPSGFVWHYRRSTIKAYLKQQAGYGEAEALLMGKHPEHFNSFGGGLWRGRIYAPSYSGLLLRRSVIYHGIFGSGFFQRLYTPDPVQPLMLCNSLGYHVFVTVPLLLLAGSFVSFVPLAITSLLLSTGVCALAAVQAKVPRKQRRFWSRPLVGLLFLLQPIIRGWAKFKWRLNLISKTPKEPEISGKNLDESPAILSYWSDGSVERYGFLQSILLQIERHGWSCRTDSGWSTHDLDIPAALWTRLSLITAGEDLEGGKKRFRCLIRGAWTFPAKLIFVTISLGVLLSIAFLARLTPWIWESLVALPVLAWILAREQHSHEYTLATLIDRAATDQALTKLQEDRPAAS